MVTVAVDAAYGLAALQFQVEPQSVPRPVHLLALPSTMIHFQSWACSTSWTLNAARNECSEMDELSNQRLELHCQLGQPLELEKDWDPVCERNLLQQTQIVEDLVLVCTYQKKLVDYREEVRPIIAFALLCEIAGEVSAEPKKSTCLRTHGS